MRDAANGNAQQISIPFPLTNRAGADLAGITGRPGGGDGTSTVRNGQNVARATPQSVTHAYTTM